MIRKTTVNNIESYDFTSTHSSVLRDYKKSDASEIINWIKDERALKLWSADIYNTYPITADDINNNYKKCKSTSHFYIKTLTDNNKIIGHLILRNPSNDTSIVRLGFIIVNSDIRGKGYGKLLINKAIDFAKVELNAKEINLGVFDINTSAYNCYKSVGFVETGIEKNAFNFNNETWNCIEMKLKMI